MKSPIFFSLMAILFLHINPYISFGCVIIIFFSLFKFNLKRSLKSMPKSFTVTEFSISAPIEELRKTYSDNPNNPTLLNRRETELVRILTGAIQRKFKHNNYEEHFKITTFINHENKIVSKIEPKTSFANAVLTEIMNVRMKEDKYYMED